jgi:hypothetical protein
MVIDTALTRKIASHQMMILSATRYVYRDVPVGYPSMVDQTNHQRQTKPHHLPWLKSEYYGNTYNKKTISCLIGEEK